MAIRDTYTTVIDVVQDWHDRIVLINSLGSQIEAARARIQALNTTISTYQGQLDTAVSDEASLSQLLKQFATTESWTTFINAAIAAGKQGQ